MPKQSYKDYRAQRQAAAGSDTESLASYSTFASHTTLSSLPARRSQSPFTGSPGPQFGNAFSSSLSPSPWAHSTAWPHGPERPPDRSRTLSTGSWGIPSSSSIRNLSGSPPPQSFTPAAGSHAQVRNSSLDASASASATASASISAPGTHRSRRRAAPGSPNLSPVPHHSSHLNASALPSPGLSGSSAEADAAAKRRRRAKAEERWRRVRAREAAHDAPVRRWAKAIGPKLGAQWTLVVTVLAAMVIRSLVTLVAYFMAPGVRQVVASQVAAGKKLLVGPDALPVLKAISAAFPSLTSAITPSSILARRLLLEVFFGWSATVAWTTITGKREGRTLRTKVTAVIYLILAPALTLSDGILMRARTIPLGLVAWTLVTTSAGHDNFATAALTAAVWSDSTMWSYVPAFIVYAFGKRIWLGPNKRGFLARLAVTAALSYATLEMVLRPAPLRARIQSIVASASPSALKSAFVWLAARILTLKAVLFVIGLAPSAYLLLRASIALRPGRPQSKSRASMGSDSKNSVPSIAAPNTNSVPATIRLLPLALAATSAAAAVADLDAALPLLPLAFASATRGDDDEWAVAVQAHQIAAIALWPALSRMSSSTLGLIPVAAAYQLGWGYVVGARQDAPEPALQLHQRVTAIVMRLALVAPFVPLIKLMLAPLARSAPLVSLSSVPAFSQAIRVIHVGFIGTSLALLAVWSTLRMVKTAWTIGAL